MDSNGDGDLSSIQAGIMQVVESSQVNTSRRVVVNLSLGGPKSTLFDNAIMSLTNLNLFVSVSAGNSGDDACNYSPADLGDDPTTIVMSVAASDINDFRPSFSNYGSCVTISAPGVSVTGAWYTSDTATNVLDGTSMSSPLVCGVGAIILQEELSLSISSVKSKILTWATPNIIDYTSSTGGGKNLLFSLVVPSETPPTEAPTTTPPTSHNVPPPPPEFLSTSSLISFNLLIYTIILSLMLS